MISTEGYTQLVNHVESYATEIVLFFGAVTRTSYAGVVSLVLFPSVAIY